MPSPIRASFGLAALGLVASACNWGSGSKWMAEPMDEERAPMQSGGAEGPTRSTEIRTIGGKREADRTGGGGRVLGRFRNTYYDFPSEADHKGDKVSLKNASCETIADVPRGFFEAVCVQGSGSLARGGTVSFAKRDCACADVCPRTGQRICFDALDPGTFPWGRGAAGTPITPLRSVAADTSVLPMGTVLYIPELDGAPRAGDERPIDGCFVVEDRGLRVQGEHVDIFTGHPAQTAKLNAEVPSNQGVTIVVDAPKCAHLAKR